MLSEELSEALKPPTRNPNIHGGRWTSDEATMKMADDAVVKLLPVFEKALNKASGKRWKMRRRTRDWVASFSSKGQKGVQLTWRPAGMGELSYRLQGSRANLSTILRPASLTPAKIEKSVELFFKNYY